MILNRIETRNIPISSAYINSVSPPKSASAVNISGDPLPNARIVTPARFSLKPMTSERTANAGQKLKQKQ